MDENLKSYRSEESSGEVDLEKLAETISLNDTNIASTPTEPEKPKFEGYKTNTAFFHFLCVFGAVFVSMLFFLQIYLTPITVIGQSMLPNINTSTTSDIDNIHCDMVYYRAKESYNHGDIVIISNETSQYIDNSLLDNPVYFLIKRIIACPGDTITFYRSNQSGSLYYYDVIVKDVNGNQIELNEESYIKEPMVLDNHYSYAGLLGEISISIFDDDIGMYQLTMNSYQYFAMGDNRNNSSDSRYFGAINIKDICGNVRIHVKYGENIWIALFNKLKSYLSVSFIKLKENLWKNY